MKETIMIIIAGYALRDSDKRDAAVQKFADIVTKARLQDGCVDFAISADAVDPERANIFECWRDEEAWKTWRKVAKGPRVAAREVHVNLYRSDKAEKPF
jgi:quinol monooxygenase YgiN